MIEEVLWRLVFPLVMGLLTTAVASLFMPVSTTFLLLAMAFWLILVNGGILIIDSDWDWFDV